jgi:NAD+ kinase
MTNLNEALLKRNNSISSNSGASDRSEAHPARKGEQGQEGQLRYWTNDMCRKSPHLFDFVITVSPSLRSA